MNVQSLKNVFLSYRNGFYQGQMKDNKRHGYGILLLDQGAILVVNWKDDLAFGMAFCFLNNEEYGFLQFNRGELQGPCIFRSGLQLLIMQFNNGRAVDRHLLINYQEQQAKMIIYQNANFETIDKMPIKNINQSEFIEKTIGLRISIPTITDFLYKYFCSTGHIFQIKVLPNGNCLFRFLQKSSTFNIGFVFNKNEQLVSYGIYNEQKLHGFGCKYQNNIKYEGQFENGILNGEGLKFSNGKYSYGRFQNGNLIQALFMDERSNASQERLKELKRIYHIQSPQFYNGYIDRRVINFRGISQISALSSPVKEYLYNNITQKAEQNINKSTNGISLNLLLSGKDKQNQSITQHYRVDTNMNRSRQVESNNSQGRFSNNINGPQVTRKIHF